MSHGALPLAIEKKNIVISLFCSLGPLCGIHRLSNVLAAVGICTTSVSSISVTVKKSLCHVPTVPLLVRREGVGLKLSQQTILGCPSSCSSPRCAGMTPRYWCFALGALRMVTILYYACCGMEEKGRNESSREQEPHTEEERSRETKNHTRRRESREARAAHT